MRTALLLSPLCVVFSVVLACSSVWAQSLTTTTQTSFSAQWLLQTARELAERPYQAKVMSPDHPLRNLDYDDYRRIVFDPDHAIWREQHLPFQLQLFHPGFLHVETVNIHLVDETAASRLPFTPDVFNYHESLNWIEPDDAGGYAGFRVHYPINSTARHEEFLVFLGASYFRGVGREQFYGLSARGLAVNTVGAGGEEFPRFTDFWINTPDADSEQITIHALLDSPSVSGAFRFDVKPGDDTVVDVHAALFPRRELARVGIAPLTSMFMFDATNSSRFDDFRPAVHDSDGLLIVQANDEHVWRPLANPKHVQVSAFGNTMPRGFGLMQRRQDFADFNDAEARYDKRPSLWIEPANDWGDGHVELVEIPTIDEIHDNIVAYWQPAQLLEAGRQYDFTYRMMWGRGDRAAPGRVVATAAGQVPESHERLFVIDYSDGHQLPLETASGASVHVDAVSSAGRITDVSSTLVEATGHYRVYVKLDPEQAELAELRVAVQIDGRQWGETWLYRWTQ